MKTFVIALFALVAGASAAAIQQQPPVPILEQAQEVNPDGSFYSSYKSADGTAQETKGVLINPGQKDEASVIEGSASWTSPEGIPITLRWVAGPDGVQFEGAHLPVAPEGPAIPLAIQRSLDWNAAHPEQDESQKL